jgi:Second Messenger Oligonucleotide or Dinucleotide Synthetase domain
VALTVTAAFERFYDNINLGGDHRETANARRDRIISLLEDKFDIVEAFASGSVPRFTALRAHADLDVIVALHWGKHIKGRTPSQVLASVQKALSGYTTSVRRNGQAVTLKFKTWPDVDIVPASRNVVGGVVTHYNIPDMNTEAWLTSKPKRHSTNIENRSTSCGPHFRKVMKMVKWWNQNHSAMLQSFHMEVIALNAFTSPMTDLPWNVLSYFQKAVALAASSLSYDGANVDDYLTPLARWDVVRRLTKAHAIARDAWYATYGGNNDHGYAIERWRVLFGDEFPTYG